MRQLDLFGSLFETPLAEKKPEEKKPVSKAKEVSAVSKTEETYSSVELAEKALQTETSGRLDEIIITQLSDENPSEQSEQKSEISFTISEVIEENLPPETAIEELHIDTNDTISVSNSDVAVNTSEEQKVPEPQRTGAVIFDDGKITVKIKTKPIAAVEVIKEKEKKEPQKRGRKSLQEIEAEADLIEVPDDEVLFKKQYYSISEVAKWFRVNTSLLRFWENEFEILKPKKNRKGDRLFRPEDVKNLQLIYHLLRERKYTIEGAKEYIKTNRKKADIQLQLTNTLQRFKSFLLDLKLNLQS